MSPSTTKSILALGALFGVAAAQTTTITSATLITDPVSSSTSEGVSVSVSISVSVNVSVGGHARGRGQRAATLLPALQQALQPAEQPRDPREHAYGCEACVSFPFLSSCSAC